MLNSNTHSGSENNSNEGQALKMRAFYKIHARFYDATRWAFLFGRNEILKKLPLGPGSTLLEVGCGTGRNLRLLARRHPNVQFIGVDVSPSMLERAASNTAAYSNRVNLLECRYAPGSFELPHPADLVLFSYSLTMFNPGWEAAVDRVWNDLRPGGYLALVDFHDTKSKWFRWYMEKYNVRIDGHLLRTFQQRFEMQETIIRPAFLGLWRYVMFLGRKPLH